ncbi:MAG: hypothetical protein ABSD31_20445 [Candidatus Binataceae bacterium]|jgi:hypothetical protein
MKIRNNVDTTSERCDAGLPHELMIGPPCDSDLFGGKKARLYYCVECGWRLLVSEGRVAVLSEDGSPIVGEESIRQFDAFEGPCPVLEEFASAGALSQRQLR